MCIMAVPCQEGGKKEKDEKALGSMQAPVDSNGSYMRTGRDLLTGPLDQTVGLLWDGIFGRHQRPISERKAYMFNKFGWCFAVPRGDSGTVQGVLGALYAQSWGGLECLQHCCG